MSTIKVTRIRVKGAERKSRTTMEEERVVEATLYQKTFQKKDLGNLLGNEDLTFLESLSPSLTFDEIMEELYKNVTYRPLPGKAKRATVFIQEAIAFSERNRIDVCVTQSEDSVAAEFTVLCSVELVGHQRLMKLADSVMVFPPPSEIGMTLRLEYYIRAMYKRGIKVHPV